MDLAFRFLNIVVALQNSLNNCFSCILFFSKPLNKIQGGEKQITEQHYAYENAGEVYNSKQSANEVHKTVLDLDMPYFRLENVNQEVNQCRSAVHYHLKELEKRGYVIRVGVKYVDVQDLENWTLWQLKRLWKTLEQEREKAKKVAELYREKKELKQEHLEELKEDASNRWKKRQTEKLNKLQDSIDYQEQKAAVMDSNAKALMRVVMDMQNASKSNCEIREPADIQDMLERSAIAT